MDFKRVQSECDLIVNELKEPFFFLLKTSKSSSYDEINFNVIKTCFVPLIKTLLNIFNLSMAKGEFPDNLKIAWVTPI